MEFCIDSSLHHASGIYVIRNTVNDKVYIGSAKKLKVRFNSHLNQLRKGNHHSVLLQRFADKYGINKLRFELIATCDTNALLATEQVFLVQYKAANPSYGFNICQVAGSTIGRKLSAETKAKISNSHKGKEMPPHVMAVLIAANTGRVLTESQKKALSFAKRGKKKTAEEIARRTATRKANAALKPPIKMPTGFGEAVRQRNIGKRASEASRNKNAQAHIGKKQSAETIAKRIATTKANKYDGTQKLSDSR